MELKVNILKECLKDVSKELGKAYVAKYSKEECCKESCSDGYAIGYIHGVNQIIDKIKDHVYPVVEDGIKLSESEGDEISMRHIKMSIDMIFEEFEPIRYDNAEDDFATKD